MSKRRGCLHTQAVETQGGYKSATSNEEPEVPSEEPSARCTNGAENIDIAKFPVVMRPGVTPVPIPNTTVKPGAAESTTLETAWEARWLPDPYQLKCN